MRAARPSDRDAERGAPATQRVLIVDDEPTNRRLLEALVRRHGYEPMCARDGREALRVAESTPPDLVLLDVMMPDLDGYETCRRLKRLEATRHVPIVFVSVCSEVSDKIAGFEAGAADFFCKPLDVDEVMARVRGLLELRGRNQTLTDDVADPLAADPPRLAGTPGDPRDDSRDVLPRD